MRTRWSGRCGAVVLFLLLLTSGCATTIKMVGREELGRLKDEGAIRVVRYFPASVDRAAKELSLGDPVLRVRDHFLSGVEAELGLKNLQVVADPVVSDDVDQLKSAFGSGLVLDFKTQLWGINRGVVFSSRLNYQARARLIRLDESKLLWEGRCLGSSLRLPRWAQLAADEGKVLKAKLVETGEACAQVLLDQFLGRAKQNFLGITRQDFQLKGESTPRGPIVRDVSERGGAGLGAGSGGVTGL